LFLNAVTVQDNGNWNNFKQPEMFMKGVEFYCAGNVFFLVNPFHIRCDWWHEILPK